MSPYEQIATPFEWKFTRRDLDRLLDRLDHPHGATSSRTPRDPGGDVHRRVQSMLDDVRIMDSRRQHSSAAARTTWNDAARIASHRALSPKERLRLTIEASRAAQRFADGRRRVDR